MYNHRRNRKTHNGGFYVEDVKKQRNKKRENPDLIVTILH